MKSGRLLDFSDSEKKNSSVMENNEKQVKEEG